ncbi:hypothetical protein NMG60_11026416 [Bertholletia excelsa]
MTLWAIKESQSIFTTGGTNLPAVCHETKKVTAACWGCPFGSKVVVGYNNGEIFIWSVPPAPASKTQSTFEKDLCAAQSTPICKLNIGYKLDKIPIASLKWVHADGRASRVYVMGMSDASVNLVQVVLLNEYTESRTVKLGLHMPESCIDMDIISSSSEQSKHKQDAFILLGKSGHIYAYDDSAIEKYLLQGQNRSPPSLPKEIMVKLPFANSSITIAKLITDNPCASCLVNEGDIVQERLIPPLFPFNTKQKDAIPSTHVSRFSRSRNLYITGHSDGAINFWDASCPIMLPVVSIVQETQDDFSLSGVPVTAIYFDINLRLLISGDHSGTVRIFNLKPEPFAAGSSFMSLQGSSKKGSNNIVQSLRLVKVNGAVVSIEKDCCSTHLAVGSDQGYVSLIDIEGPTILYQKHIASELCTGVISLQFDSCSFHGFEKNVLVVASKDSSVLAIERDTGNTIADGLVRPKKPSRALFMQILDGQHISEPNKVEGQDSSKGNSIDDATRKHLSLLLCSEKAAYVYSLGHMVQGIKKVLFKKKFYSSSCCWASTFCTPDAAGLVLLFSSGKIEIRSLPELSLLKETSVRGFTFPAPKMNSVAVTSVCSSRDGEVIIVIGDQEMFVVSILPLKNLYRHLDSLTEVYNKDLKVAPGGFSALALPKEKKRGIFSYVIKDTTGSRTKHVPDEGTEGARETIEELSEIFSVENFPCNAECKTNVATDENETDLDIDDIDLEDHGEKMKGHPLMAAVNKQKLTSTFQAFKGKLKEMKVKNDKAPSNEEPQNEKAGAVDHIKKKYGFTSSSDSGVAKQVESKLSENLRKLQGISLRTTQMQDTARSFSSMAKEVLRLAEHDKRSS